MAAPEPVRGMNPERIKIFSGNANRALAEEICQNLGLDLAVAQVKAFADGENNIQIQENVRGADVFVVQPTCTPVNHHIMELLFMIHALKLSSAERITAVLPYYGYARQDRKVAPRTPSGLVRGSPLRPWQIIIGKVAPYLLVGFASVVGVIVEARLIFDVPLRGSVTLLFAEGTLFILVSLALGVLISARTSSQRVAMTAALLGTMLPTMILSGFIFPVESMPRVLQSISNVVPAKWFVTIARGIMLKGVGLSYLWQETLVLLGMAFVLLGAAARSFHERLE